MRNRRAFTLLELLIVVATIAILAAIAIPNFADARLRAKVTRAISDLRATGIASESYRLDHSAYPFPLETEWPAGAQLSSIRELTTPVAYIRSVALKDPFTPQRAKGAILFPFLNTYIWVSADGRWGRTHRLFHEGPRPDAFCVKSPGPNRRDDLSCTVGAAYYVNRAAGLDLHPRETVYCASNGLHSDGDLPRYGGALAGLPLID